MAYLLVRKDVMESKKVTLPQATSFFHVTLSHSGKEKVSTRHLHGLYFFAGSP